MWADLDGYGGGYGGSDWRVLGGGGLIGGYGGSSMADGGRTWLGSRLSYRWWGSPYRQCTEGLVRYGEWVFHSVRRRVCRIVPQSTDALVWSLYRARV